jgi:anti-sigma regulatory factor (Ser/Thr protein kinase)
MHSLETSNTLYDLGEVEIVLAEVLNNIAEHGGRESLNHPISLKWHTSDGLCINVIDAGQCIPRCTITNAQMPDLDTIIDDLPEGGFGWALVDILCSKVQPKRARIVQYPAPLFFEKITLPQRILISHSNSSHRRVNTILTSRTIDFSRCRTFAPTCLASRTIVVANIALHITLTPTGDLVCAISIPKADQSFLPKMACAPHPILLRHRPLSMF